jgi:alpha-tubulin suppressor-like RCC1 family protein
MSRFYSLCLSVVARASLILLLLTGTSAQAQVLRGTFAGGSSHSLSIHADGTLWATGSNSAGQLGIGTTSYIAAWVQIGTATNWVQVTAGENFSLGLRADGTLWAWGSNQRGQLGLATNAGTTAPTYQPTQVEGTYTQVAAGGEHTLALRADGTLWSWGYNGSGQLGSTTSLGSFISTPQAIPGTYTQVAAGGRHSLGLRADGTLWAWGANQYGQLGTTANSGGSGAYPTPVQVPGTWVQAAAGGNHSLALRVDGSLYAWGTNQFGQLANATTVGKITAYPTPALVAGTYTQVAAGQYHSLALTATGSLYAWGYNANGQLGVATNSGTAVPITTPALVAGTYAQVATGYVHALGLRADGTLWTWGSNISGQLGTITNVATYNDNHIPVATGVALPTRSTAAGNAFGLAVRGDGSLWAWGNNNYGQLGDGTTTTRLQPVRIGLDRDWVQVAAGDSHALALKADGTVWAWGLNLNGQLGDGTSTQHLTPTLVSGAGNCVAVTTGFAYSLALRANGTLIGWGTNAGGQLGDGTTTPRPVPTAAGGSNVYTRVAVGSAHTLALRADGTLAAWGTNQYGQLGDGSTTQRLSPVVVGAGNTYTQVVAGQGHTLALRATGAVWSWGLNGNGQLGDGTTTTRSAPALVSGTGIYTRVAAGFSHSGAVQATGTIWTWGANQYGQAGLGPALAPVYVPTQEVTNNTGWTSLTSGPGASFSLARTASAQSFASTGFNSDGQLGDGTTATANRFDRVSPLLLLQPLPVRIGSASSTAGLMLAPNPAHGLVQVQGLSAGGTLAVYNALGQLMRPAASANATLDVAGLPAGVYMVRAVGADGSGSATRLVVE